jgi:hypothetical protein
MEVKVQSNGKVFDASSANITLLLSVTSLAEAVSFIHATVPLICEGFPPLLIVMGDGLSTESSSLDMVHRYFAVMTNTSK